MTRNEWDAEKEIVVVTCGSSGIGANVVGLLEQRNIKTIILDTNAPLRELGTKYMKSVCILGWLYFANTPEPRSGCRTAFYEIDLCDAEAIATIADRIRSEHKYQTVLVNNAGTTNADMITSVTPKKLRRIFDVNLFAPFLLVRQFLPEMVAANHRHVVNMASIASFSV